MKGLGLGVRKEDEEDTVENDDNADDSLAMGLRCNATAEPVSGAVESTGSSISKDGIAATEGATLDRYCAGCTTSPRFDASETPLNLISFQ